VVVVDSAVVEVAVEVVAEVDSVTGVVEVVDEVEEGVVSVTEVVAEVVVEDEVHQEGKLHVILYLCITPTTSRRPPAFRLSSLPAMRSASLPWVIGHVLMFGFSVVLELAVSSQPRARR
jgi:hypothetical protein